MYEGAYPLFICVKISLTYSIAHVIMYVIGGVKVKTISITKLQKTIFATIKGMGKNEKLGIVKNGETIAVITKKED